MKAWQFGMFLVVVAGGGVAIYMATRPKSKGAPPPVVSVHTAAATGTGSSGGTNEYDAVIGIAGAIGGAVSSGIESGFFSDLFSSDEPAVATTGSGLVAPGQSILF